MVARGAGAAGPVLLACRQWDPLGLARRLPSLGVGAWRCAPLLPWRVQCPVCVFPALAAGSGGSGRYLVLCLSRFPLPAPRVPRCVWRAVPSGCPLPEKTEMWRLDECDVSGQTIRLQAILARMNCDEILAWVGEEVLKEYRNLHHTRGLRPGDRDVNYVGEGPGGEASMDPAGADGDEALDNDDDDDEPAEMAVCAFVANNLNAGSNRGSWKPLQKDWKKKEKKDPRRIGNPPLSFGEFIRAHPQGCFVCYGRNKGFKHDHRTCPIHQADTEAYKKVHVSKKRAPAGIRETKVEVSKDELSKLMSVGTELAKEIQEIKRSLLPKSDDKNKENKENDKNKDKDKKGKKGEKKKGVNEVDVEESTPTTTTDAP